MNTLLLGFAGEVTTGILIGRSFLFIIFGCVVLVAKMMVVGNPSEMLIISGQQQRDGMGYRVLIGGRTLVIPLIEKVSRLSLRNMQVPLEGKMRAGGPTNVPVLVKGVASVKVSSNPDERCNAIERFLDQPVDDIQRTARDTLEGGLRAVIRRLTPEEIDDERDKFVQTVMHEVSDDFRKFGLSIDSFNIQDVVYEQTPD